MSAPFPLHRQFAAFFGVGLIAAIVHYGLLVALVEGAKSDPVPATLVGYLAGGAVSYILNRRHTYASSRAHREAAWRFIFVALVGFLLTGVIMVALTEFFFVPYLIAQLIATGTIIVWSFVANKVWTFTS